jgi:hypothetical protein
VALSDLIAMESSQFRSEDGKLLAIPPMVDFGPWLLRVATPAPEPELIFTARYRVRYTPIGCQTVFISIRSVIACGLSWSRRPFGLITRLTLAAPAS